MEHSGEKIRWALQRLRQPWDVGEDVAQYFSERNKAVDVLAGSGQAGIAALLETLHGGEADFLTEAGQILRKLGPPAMRRLLEDMEASEQWFLYRALTVLAEFEIDAVPAIPAVARLLKSTDPEVRLRALHILQRIGAESASLLPEILMAAADSHATVREVAVGSLRTTGIRNDEVRSALVRLVGDDDAAVRRGAVKCFSDLFSGIRPPDEEFRRLLCDPAPSVREEVFRWIVALGPDAPDATAELTRALADPKLSFDAAKALWASRRRADLVMPIVQRGLMEPNWGEVERICDLVAFIGEPAKAAAPQLSELLKEQDYDLLWAVTDALAALGEHAESAIPLLVVRLDHPSGLVANGAARALARIGTAAFPAVFEALRTASARGREFAADSLGQMGAIADDAIPELVRLCRDKSTPMDLVCWASLAAAEIRPAPQWTATSVALLHEGLASNMRLRAARVLGRIGKGAQDAIPRLRALATGKEELARTAADALREIVQ